MATNAEWMIQQGHKFTDLNVRHKGPDEYNSFVVRLNGEKLDEFELGDGQALCEFALKKWLDMAHKEPILDEAERRYLSAVIKPFRDEIVYIVKIPEAFPYESIEYIYIYIKNRLCGDFEKIRFPKFATGTMYKGMEVGRKYTLEELGL